MKKSEVLDLNLAIQTCASVVGGKFGYALARNANIIKSEVESIAAAINPSKEFEAYERKRVELKAKFSKKVDGKPILEGKNYILEDEEGWNKAFDKLKKDNSKVLDAREKQVEEFEDLLKENAPEFKFYKISPEWIPENITAQQVLGIACLLDEEDHEKENKNGKKQNGKKV